MGIGELFSLVCALMWASAVVLYKHAGESMSANTLNLVKNVIGIALLVPTALLLEGLVIPSLDLHVWLIVFASGYLGIAIADTLYLLTLRTIGASRTAIVASLYSPFVVLFSMIFLGESLLPWQWLGLIMVLTGILVVVYRHNAQTVESSQLFKGLLFGALSVFMTAAGVVAMKPILSDQANDESFFWLVTIRMFAGVLGMLIYLAIKREVKSTIAVVFGQAHKWKTIYAASCCGSYLALLFWLAGFKYADASVASVLNETANVFIVVLAALFLKESIDLRKIIGISLTFFGVIVFLGHW
ncbi:MAG: DMT family transporter [Gammaproteobacteria bacterium]|nr:DMT family transporter [Gammaproteobacteria bacterium]